MQSSVQSSQSQRASQAIDAKRDPRRATIGWWGVTSLTAALLAIAFIPASVFGGSGWGGVNSAWPIWTACCVVGAVTGIHGLQKQRRATAFQRRLAFAGTLCSLLFFIALVIIALIALQ